MSSIFSKVLTFFVLIGVGYVIRRIRLVEESFSKALSVFVLYIALPALVINSMQFQFSPEMFSNSVILLIAGGVLYAMLWLIGITASRFICLSGSSRAVFLYASLLGNVAYLGYPVVELVLGREGVFYAAVFNVWFNVLTWTTGIRIMTGGKKGAPARALLNPGTISIMIGFLIFVFSIPLPSFLDESLSLLGESTIPLAMVVVGVTLAGVNTRKMAADRRVLLYSLLKLVLAPCIVMLILRLFDLQPIVENILIIMSAMPAAANTSIFARLYDSDYEFASKLIAVSTLFSLISIPVIISLID